MLEFGSGSAVSGLVPVGSFPSHASCCVSHEGAGVVLHCTSLQFVNQLRIRLSVIFFPSLSMSSWMRFGYIVIVLHYDIL